MAVANPSVVRPERKPPTASDGKLERERLRMMMLIRRLEERTYTEYTKPGQKIGGFCHLYSGQEAVSVGVAAVFDKTRDALINAYRCHGHSLALGMSAHAVMAELFGKATGCSKGKGGSMHLFQAEVGNHGGHGIVGGHLPVALGFAFAQQYKKNGGATICLFGDGAINQGTFNESMNMASLWKLPVVYVVENNGVAMGTTVERHSAERDLAKRGAGFAMPYYNVDGMDLDTVIEAVGEAFARCRAGEGPTFLSINTYRYRGHSMSDPLKYRSKEEAEKWKKRDPITIYFERIKARGFINDEQLDAMQDEVNAEVEAAIRQADADPHPALEERFDDILAETYPFDGKGR
jgi:pyruvate dehydrogenase E1 component alpha subunit